MKRQHTIFIAEYVIHRNAARAARAAGYRSPRNTGSRLLRDPEIKAEIDRRTEKHLSTQGIDTQWVVDAIVNEVRQGQMAGNKSTTVLRGLELLAKYLGMFVERTEVSIEATMLDKLAERMREGQERVLEAKELPEGSVQ